MNLPSKLILSALGLAVIFDALLYKSEPGINILMLELIVLVTFYWFARKTGHYFSSDAVIAAVFAVLFAAVFAVWTSDIGLILSFFGLLVSNTALVFAIWGHSLNYSHPFQVIFDFIVYSTKLVGSRFAILTQLSFSQSKKRRNAILRGLIIALPVVIIFGALFLSSDLILQEKTQAFFDKIAETFDYWSIIPHAFIIGFFFLIFLLIFAAAFWKRFEFSLPATYGMNMHTETLVVLVASNVLFIAFLIFQSVYLFGGQAAFAGLADITYSQYAVKGFAELASVSVLVILLILSLRHLYGSLNAKFAVKLAEGILIIETVFLLISSWMRLDLYVAQYGYTPARLFGFWFFILAAILLGLLLGHIVKRVKQSVYMRQGIVLVGAAMLVFTALSPDALSVRLNVARAEQTGEPMDPFPLFFSLSAEAYPLMDYVLSSGEVEIGLLNTTITDYCPFVRAHYQEGKIFNFTSIAHSGIDKALRHDFVTRIDIANFKNKWQAQPEKDEYEKYQTWRSWNITRAGNPPKDQEKIDDRTVPYPADQIAHACGMYEGDPK